MTGNGDMVNVSSVYLVHRISTSVSSRLYLGILNPRELLNTKHPADNQQTIKKQQIQNGALFVLIVPSALNCEPIQLTNHLDYSRVLLLKYRGTFYYNQHKEWMGGWMDGP